METDSLADSSWHSRLRTDLQYVRKVQNKICSSRSGTSERFTRHPPAYSTQSSPCFLILYILRKKSKRRQRVKDLRFRFGVQFEEILSAHGSPGGDYYAIFSCIIGRHFPSRRAYCLILSVEQASSFDYHVDLYCHIFFAGVTTQRPQTSRLWPLLRGLQLCWLFHFLIVRMWKHKVSQELRSWVSNEFPS